MKKDMEAMMKVCTELRDAKIQSEANAKARAKETEHNRASQAEAQAQAVSSAAGCPAHLAIRAHKTLLFVWNASCAKLFQHFFGHWHSACKLLPIEREFRNEGGSRRKQAIHKAREPSLMERGRGQTRSAEQKEQGEKPWNYALIISRCFEHSEAFSALKCKC